MCRNTGIKFLSRTYNDTHIYIYIYTTLTFLGKHVIQTNPSKFDERLFSDIYICADYVSNREEKYRILCFEAGGVPEGRSSEGYASFKQVKPWPWHVEVIPGVSVMGLVTNKNRREFTKSDIQNCVSHS